jgi:hypothetical protein
VIGFGQYGRKESWTVKEIWKIQKKGKLNSEKIWKMRRKVGWIVKWYGKYEEK